MDTAFIVRQIYVRISEPKLELTLQICGLKRKRLTEFRENSTLQKFGVEEWESASVSYGHMLLARLYKALPYRELCLQRYHHHHHHHLCVHQVQTQTMREAATICPRSLQVNL